jgi:hypothetical protein
MTDLRDPSGRGRQISRAASGERSGEEIGQIHLDFREKVFYNINYWTIIILIHMDDGSRWTN